jgi:hypothetical protein
VGRRAPPRHRRHHQLPRRDQQGLPRCPLGRDFAWHNTFIGLGIGIAVHNGETFTSDPEAKELGRRVLFHPNVEIGRRLDQHQSISLYFEHISNASLATKNQGLDTLGVRYGYRF